MNIARHLISGVDVWLNNPRRPHEASGTSGEKAAASGVPNLSVLDGWWVEGYNGENGWAIGEEREYKDEETQDEADALSLYQILEYEIIPTYYDRGADGVPHRWVQIMKNSIASCAPEFSMSRMVKDYVNQYYLPAAATGDRYQSEDYAVAKTMSEWKDQIRRRWINVGIEATRNTEMQIAVGQSLELNAKVWLSGMLEDEVAVEIVSGLLDDAGAMIDPAVSAMAEAGQQDTAVLYHGALSPENSGQIAVGIRVRPTHKDLIDPYELGLSKWA